MIFYIIYATNVKHGLFISLAASFSHTLPLELIENSTFIPVIFLKGHLSPLAPLGKGKEGACPPPPPEPPLSGVPGYIYKNACTLQPDYQTSIYINYYATNVKCVSIVLQRIHILHAHFPIYH
jgi:hypothetical protein